MLDRKYRIRIWVGLFMALYFTVYFLMLTHIVEQNRMNPYHGTAHDANGIPIGQ
jgi:hypothetical protein